MAEPTAQPSRDRGHEALRQDILAAVADLNQTSGDTATSLDLTDLVFELVDSLYAQIDAANIRADASEIRARTAYDAIDDLQRRVGLLENPTNPPE